MCISVSSSKLNVFVFCVQCDLVWLDLERECAPSETSLSKNVLSSITVSCISWRKLKKLWQVRCVCVSVFLCVPEF